MPLESDSLVLRLFEEFGAGNVVSRGLFRRPMRAEIEADVFDEPFATEYSILVDGKPVPFVCWRHREVD